MDQSASPPMSAELAADFRLLVDSVREAGALAASYFGRQISSAKKADGSDVSEADLAVDELLNGKLSGARPAYGWLSEESVDDPARLGTQRVWIVDPIDGTRAFLAGTPTWTVVVALVEDGLPILSSVFNPIQKQMFTAVRGGGAFLNEMPIGVEDRSVIDGTRMAANKSLFKKDIWPEPWPDMDIVWINSTAYRMALLASGKVDATLELAPKFEWDLAAPALLVQEAGGRVTASDGSALHFNNHVPRLGGLVAAGPMLHDLLIARTQAVVSRTQ